MVCDGGDLLFGKPNHILSPQVYLIEQIASFAIVKYLVDPLLVFDDLVQLNDVGVDNAPKQVYFLPVFGQVFLAGQFLF